MAKRAGMATESLRRANLSRVLRLLHVDGPATRAELTARTGLNRSTVGDLVADLAARDLVVEGQPQATGSRGRPSPLVSVRTDTVAVLAVDVKVDSVAVAVVTLGGHVAARERVERLRARTGVDDTVKDVTVLAREVMEAMKPGQRLFGVGVSVAGLVHTGSGLVHVGPNLGWRDVVIADLVTEALGHDAATRVLNDADAGAVAEWLRGAGRDIDHLVYLSGEVGVGGGIIVRGQVMLGHDGYAGEIGHTVIDADGRPCRCGAVGCWETRVGEAALLRLAGESEDGGRGAVDRVLAAADAGDPVALGALEELAWWMGVGIAGLVNTFNPQRVVLGDLHARLHRYVEGPVRDHLARASLVASRSQVDVVPSVLGDDAALIGAAEAVLEGLLDDPAGSESPPERTDVEGAW